MASVLQSEDLENQTALNQWFINYEYDESKLINSITYNLIKVSSYQYK